MVRRPRAARAAVTLAAGLLIVMACRDRSVTAPRESGTVGTVVSRRFDVSGSMTVTPQVSAGAMHACALKTNGTLVCWGLNNLGQATPPPGSFTQLSTRYLDACAVRVDGTLACWGSNRYGQSTPPTGSFTQVGAGMYHNCAVRTDGRLACWGLMSAPTAEYGQATPPTGSFTNVSAGLYHTCAVKTDGTLACWGDNSYGQLTSPPGSFTQVSAGQYHACALKEDGTLACWGLNNVDQATPPTGSFTQLSAGWRHNCAVNTDGTLACWGHNEWGKSTPPAGSFTHVSAGVSYTCAVRTGGTLACWGDNSYGKATPPVWNSPPVANAGGPYAGSEGSAVAFNGAASMDPDGDALTFAWDFGDGSVAATAAPSHLYATSGLFPVTLTVTDPSGALHATTTTATIANVAPSVSPIAGATILRGETFAGTGTFLDPGADQWTATVDYGDGTAVQALALSGKSFALAHPYTSAGTFTLAVRVTDHDGGLGTSQALVVVQNPSEGIQALGDVVGTLVSSGAVSSGNGQALTTKLEAAQNGSGNEHAAVNAVGAFINQVNALMKSGKLSADDGQTLIAFANRILLSFSQP